MRLSGSMGRGLSGGQVSDPPEEDRGRLTQRMAEHEEKLRLLPKSIRKVKTAVKDDF